jgi:Lrp/AsnC family transcriptional regulator of lysine biosynthesis
MDSTDSEILELLKKDSRRSFVDIASKVGLTEGAIRRRVKNLVETGVIQRFTIETRSDVEAIILIQTDPTRTKKVTERVRRVAERVFETSGNYDTAAFIRTSTLTELDETVDGIRAFPGVRSTSTLIKMNQQ